MQQADRAFISIARRPAIRAAALLWIWLTVVFAPVGATLHAMSHLTMPPAHDQHSAAEHCHVCDEWQFLDHVLPSAVLANTAAAPLISPAPTPPAMRLFAEAPWILPRAPPRSAASGAC